MSNKLHPRRREGFTLVEIMIVVAIVALLAAIAIPGFLRARKRSQAARILNDLRSIDSAVDQYAIENSKTSGQPVPTAAWTQYIKKGSLLYDTAGNPTVGSYGAQTVDIIPSILVVGTPPGAGFDALSDVAPSSFWTPYY